MLNVGEYLCTSAKSMRNICTRSLGVIDLFSQHRLDCGDVRLPAPVLILPNRRSWAIILAIWLSNIVAPKRVHTSPIAANAHFSGTIV
jgi:hypothetical protein